MSISATILRHLASLCLSQEQMSGVLTIIAEITESDDLRRRKEAERTAQYRRRGGGAVPEEVRQQVFERDGWKCLDCESSSHLQVDHIHPVSKGGNSEIENLQTLCRSCNARKKDRIRKNDLRNVQGMSKDIPADTPPKEKSPTPPKEITPSPSLRSVTNPVREALRTVLDEERADALIEHRQRIRKPMTEHAALTLAKKFAACPDPNAAADEMISNGWQGFKPEWITQRQSGAGPPHREPVKNGFAAHFLDQMAQHHERDQHQDQPEYVTGAEP